MIRSRGMVGAVVLALAIPAAGSAGAIVFDNGVLPTIGVSVGFGDPFTLADDFQLAQGQTINGVSWRGAYRFGVPVPQADDFTIRVYADGGGQPTGSPLMAETVSAARSSAGTLQSLPVYAYDAAITPIVLAANTRYWMAIDWIETGAYSPTAWIWLADQSVTGNAQVGNGIVWTSVFSLVGVGELDLRVLADVPEPSGPVLLGVGLAALATARRRSPRPSA